MFRLFAELIAKHLDADKKLAITETALVEERALAELREQFIGILGHDLRTPMRAITSFSELMLQRPPEEDVTLMARNRARERETDEQSDREYAGSRPRSFCRRSVNPNSDRPLEPMLREVMGELETAYPERRTELFSA